MWLDPLCLLIVHVCSVAESCLTLVIPGTVAHQTLLDMIFPSNNMAGGWPFPSPGDLPGLWRRPVSPAWQEDSLPLSHLGSPKLGFYLPVETGRWSLCLPRTAFLREYLNLKGAEKEFYSCKFSKVRKGRSGVYSQEETCQAEID